MSGLIKKKEYMAPRETITRLLMSDGDSDDSAEMAPLISRSSGDHQLELLGKTYTNCPIPFLTKFHLMGGEDYLTQLVFWNIATRCAKNSTRKQQNAVLYLKFLEKVQKNSPSIHNSIWISYLSESTEQKASYVPNWFKREFWQVFHLSWSLCLISLFTYLLEPISLYFCGKLGTDELAAVALSNSVSNFFGIVQMSCSYSISLKRWTYCYRQSLI